MTKETKKVISEIEKMTETETETVLSNIIEMYTSTSTLVLVDVLSII